MLKDGVRNVVATKGTWHAKSRHHETAAAAFDTEVATIYLALQIRCINPNEKPQLVLFFCPPWLPVPTVALGH